MSSVHKDKVENRNPPAPLSSPPLLPTSRGHHSRSLAKAQNEITIISHQTSLKYFYHVSQALLRTQHTLRGKLDSIQLLST